MTRARTTGAAGTRVLRGSMVIAVAMAVMNLTTYGFTIIAARLLGPTGGYLLSYPMAAFVTGWLGALALIVQTWAQAHLPPTRSAIIMSMEPVFAAFFAVGAYATGNKQRGIRNYGMNASPLNFSDMGYDLTGPQVQPQPGPAVLRVAAGDEEHDPVDFPEAPPAVAAAPAGSSITEAVDALRAVPQHIR